MLLDIGVGILFSLLVGKLFAIDISASWVACGVLFALLPDIDIVPYAFKRYFNKKEAYNHRTFTHYPIVYLPLVYVVYVVFGLPYALLCACGVYFHLLHDTVWLGWGISWFWPFSTRKYKSFPDENGKISSVFMTSWSAEDEDRLFREGHNPHWVRDFYLRPNIVAYFEYTVFIVSIIALIFAVHFK